MTLVLFDTNYDMKFNGLAIKKVEPLNDNTYVPDGCTALLDAIGRTIDSVGKRLSETSEEKRAEKVIVAILTDGLENSSTDFTKSRVWEFIYLGANQDALKEAEGLGVPISNSANFINTGEGTRVAYASVGESVANYRAGGSAAINNKEKNNV